MSILPEGWMICGICGRSHEPGCVCPGVAAGDHTVVAKPIFISPDTARAIGDLTAFGHGNTAEEKRINRYWDLIDEHGEERFYAEVDKIARKIQTMLIAANRSSMVPGDYGPIVHFSAAATLYLRERSDRAKAKENSRRELDRRNAEIIQANVVDEIMQANIVGGPSVSASPDDTQETAP